MSKLMRELKQAEESRLTRRHALERSAADAAAEQEARGRIQDNAGRLERLRTTELAEAEAEALARIRAQSERTLSAQALALADAERKLELASIGRRGSDIEAARAATEREAAERAAQAAAERRAEAERQAAQAAASRTEAARQASSAAEARARSEREKKSALATRYRAEWAAFWAGARPRPVALIGSVMLALGLGGGYGLAARLPKTKPAGGPLPESSLRLDDGVEAFGQRVAALPPGRP